MLKRKKVLAVLLAATTCLGMLVGCGGSSSGGGQASGGGADAASGPDTYSMIDNFDVTTLDYIYNNKSSNGDYTCNFIEGLLTQDSHGTLVAGMASD